MATCLLPGRGEALEPIPRFAAGVSQGDDKDVVVAQRVQDCEGKSRQQEPVKFGPAHHETRPCLWSRHEGLDRILDLEPAFLTADDHDHDHHHDHDHGHDHHHHGNGLKHYHDEDMQSVALRTDKPLNPDKFFPWVQDLVATEGKDILRCKGILSFKDDPERFVFQGVHMILDGDHQRPWSSNEKRESRAVFIGRHLPEDKIRKGFESCVA